MSAVLVQHFISSAGISAVADWFETGEDTSLEIKGEGEIAFEFHQRREVNQSQPTQPKSNY